MSDQESTPAQPTSPASPATPESTAVSKNELAEMLSRFEVNIMRQVGGAIAASRAPVHAAPPAPSADAARRPPPVIHSSLIAEPAGVPPVPPVQEFDADLPARLAANPGLRALIEQANPGIKLPDPNEAELAAMERAKMGDASASAAALNMTPPGVQDTIAAHQAFAKEASKVASAVKVDGSTFLGALNVVDMARLASVAVGQARSLGPLVCVRRDVASFDVYLAPVAAKTA